MRPADRLRACLSIKFVGQNEAQLQDALQTLLKASYSHVRREHRLTETDRIDFLVERTGIEVKIQGSLTQVMRQLRRYADSDDVDDLVLVTTRALHRQLPHTLGGKPLTVIWLPPF